MFATSLTKTFTAGILAATLALTSITPTRANADVTEGDAIVGIITLLLLGAALSDNNNVTIEPRTVQPPRNNWRILPAECRRTFETRRGDRVRMFTRRCMQNNYRHVDRLPDDCFVRIRTDRGERRQGWRARCLRNAGFRVNRH